MKFLIANWKMNLVDSDNWLLAFNENFDNSSINNSLEIVICPSFTQLAEVAQKSFFKNKIKIGAQNVSENPPGPYTGEISTDHLSQFGINYCIVGHSERRALGESNSDVKNKVKKLLSKKITPIVCFGESLEIQEKRETEKFLLSQLDYLLKDKDLDLNKCIFAYEPLWAIGKGVAADLQTINTSISYVKKVFDKNNSSLTVLYGGSVNKDNSLEILSADYISGFLIGNSSLDGKEFANIAKNF